MGQTSGILLVGLETGTLNKCLFWKIVNGDVVRYDVAY